MKEALFDFLASLSCTKLFVHILLGIYIEILRKLSRENKFECSLALTSDASKSKSINASTRDSC